MSIELPVPPSGETYSFSCPQCGARLLSALPEKLTAVECDACSELFYAQAALPPRLTLPWSTTPPSHPQRPVKKSPKAGKKALRRGERSSSLSAGGSSSADGVSVDSHSTILTVGSSNWSFSAASPINLALIERNDDTSSDAIISAFDSDPLFSSLARKEKKEILQRDAEDDEKLAEGIALAVAKKVLPANPPSQKVKTIDVLGKSADAVAAEIIGAVGEAAERGCVVVVQGLSGTGKGTTVAKLQGLLPRAVCWSNGNVFRALTLLALSYCEKHGLPFCTEALTPGLLSELMRCIKYDKFKGKFDIRICGHGFDVLVSEVSGCETGIGSPPVRHVCPCVSRVHLCVTCPLGITCPPVCHLGTRLLRSRMKSTLPLASYASVGAQVANTLLKEPRIGANIPTVAKMTQGEVITFAAAAVEAMHADGMNVLIEGRAQASASAPS
ncbi:MAG: hypothetical protein SGPRY_013120 [Prymnesium sp.]